MPFLKVAPLLLLWKQSMIVHGRRPYLETKICLKKCKIYISQSPVHLNDTTYSTHSDIVHLRCGTFKLS